MHTVLSFASILLVVSGSFLLLFLLRSLSRWSQRRLVQAFILVMPLVTLGIGLSGQHHFTNPSCCTTTPLWDLTFGVILPLGMVIVALGALAVGGLRLLLMARVVRRYRMPAPLLLQASLERLAKHLKVAAPRVWLCASDRPLAFTCGIFRPTIVISTWMFEHLDQQEVEAVLTHELEHVVRHDYLVVFLATILRDAFFYLPTSRTAYRQLQKEKELVCDELAVQVTRRPLALASALAKVWIYIEETPRLARFGVVQALAEMGQPLNTRIERLLARQTTGEARSSRSVTLILSALILLILLIVLGTNLFIILSLMHCNPLALFKAFF